MKRLARLAAGSVQRRGYTGRACPSCGVGLATGLPVCGRCKYVGRVPETMSHHELLGVAYEPNPFVVDKAVLKRRFVDAQRLCHPDGWATRSEGDKEKALAASNAVNTAYKTLTSPVERIEYLLRRNGAGVGETDGVEDMALITEVLEMREAIEDGGQDDLERLRAANEGMKSATMDEIADAVGRSDWARARSCAVRLKYLQGIEDALSERGGD